jgi:hypothetical protein
LKTRLSRDLFLRLSQQIQQFLTSTELSASAQMFATFYGEVVFILKCLQLICTSQEFQSIRNDLKPSMFSLKPRLIILEQAALKMSNTSNSNNNGSPNLNQANEDESKEQQFIISQLTEFLKSFFLF